MTVKIKNVRPFTFSRWNENLVCKDRQAKRAYKTHQTAIKLKSEKDNVLSKIENAVLRENIGI